jgi:hypothetical protein
MKDGQSAAHIHGIKGGDEMIIVPADKLWNAVEKNLLPGLLRHLAEQQKLQVQKNEKRALEYGKSSERKSS